MPDARLLLSASLLLAAAGCRATVSYDELLDAHRATIHTSFPSELILERADHKYAYYRIQQDFGKPRYDRVPREELFD